MTRGKLHNSEVLGKRNNVGKYLFTVKYAQNVSVSGDMEKMPTVGRSVQFWAYKTKVFFLPVTAWALQTNPVEDEHIGVDSNYLFQAVVIW